METDDATTAKAALEVSEGGGIVGTVINTTATTAGQIVKFLDNTKTNVGPASAADGTNWLGMNLVGLFDAKLSLSGGTISGDLDVTGTFTSGTHATDELILTSLTETNKLAGIGYGKTVVVGTKAMWTNTAGIFNGVATDYLGGDAAMHSLTEAMVTNALARVISGTGPLIAESEIPAGGVVTYGAVTNALSATGESTKFLDASGAWRVLSESELTNALSMNLVGLLAEKAPLASPTLTGTATIPTAAVATQTLGSGTVTNNIGALLSVGDVTFVDVTRASQTNNVTDAIVFTHATNGVGGVDYTHVRWMFNSAGENKALTIPAGWRTNVYSAVPPALTNATITRMVLSCGGPTPDAASQTNCYVSFEYFK